MVTGAGAWLLHTSPGGLHHSPADTPHLTSVVSTSDMEWPAVKWAGEGPRSGLLFRAGAFFLLTVGAGVASVSLATRGQTDMRGLVTAGRWFGRNGTACLDDERGPDRATHRCFAGRSSRCDHSAHRRTSVGVRRVQSKMARDQHQPDSSRAIATLATVLRLRRSMNVTHRWCSRRLPSSPRARAAAGARSHRSRMVLPAT